MREELVLHASAADHIRQQLQVRPGHEKRGVAAAVRASIAGAPARPVHLEGGRPQLSLGRDQVATTCQCQLIPPDRTGPNGT